MANQQDRDLNVNKSTEQKGGIDRSYNESKDMNRDQKDSSFKRPDAGLGNKEESDKTANKDLDTDTDTDAGSNKYSSR